MLTRRVAGEASAITSVLVRRVGNDVSGRLWMGAHQCQSALRCGASAVSLHQEHHGNVCAFVVFFLSLSLFCHLQAKRWAAEGRGLQRVSFLQVRRAAGRRAAAAVSSSSAPRSSSSTRLKLLETPTRVIKKWTLLPLPVAVYHKQPCSLAFWSWPCKDNGDNCAA